MTDPGDLAGVTAMALVREAAARRMDPRAYNPGEMVTEYLTRVWNASGRPDTMEVGQSLGDLIGALVSIAGASALALISASAGKALEDVTDAELRERLDSLEIGMLLRGGLRG